MYIINHTKDSNKKLDFIEIGNTQKNTNAKIYLNMGGSLDELIINSHHIIKNLHPLTYDTTYASSILFPFANRIKDGRYKFEGKIYQFEINQQEEHNALHGLVYNKTFELVEQKTTKEEAVVILRYKEEIRAKAFPYTYSIDLKYTFREDSLDLHVTVKNTDITTFPFTLGWHPYFKSLDLFNSSICFDSNKSVAFDHRNITVGLATIALDDNLKIEGKSLDDCFVLDSNEILFKTPNYKFVLTSSEKESFLQLYTPPLANTIAIEPTTGISDSFNNGIGLKTLQPDDTYNISWNIKIDNH